MFGHDDNGQMTQDAAPQGAMPDGTLGAAPTNQVAVDADAGATVADMSSPAPGPGYGTGGYSPAEPAEDDATAAAVLSAAPADAAPEEPATAAPAAAGPVSAGDPVGDTADDLLQIKQQALQQLSPLVGHLDQSPEEKFRTTMMMIQASDNQDLIKGAYAAAQQIPDEKTRAQALLDIVNEINYFTQHQAQQVGLGTVYGRRET